MAYVYRHIRLDNNEPFYIGIGSDSDYSRAYTHKNRNNHWKNIVANSEYRVEILFDELTVQDAKQKEIEFISIYGKRCDKTGSLVNLTNGGDGLSGFKHTHETKKKIGYKSKQYTFSESHRANISLNRKNKGTRAVIDSSNGIIYESAKIASRKIGLSYSTFVAMLNGQNPNKTTLSYL